MEQKRLITKQQEEAYRLVHHDFGGKTTKVAAELMGLSVRRVQVMLVDMKKIAPQLFPILSKHEAMIVDSILGKNLTVEQVAELSGLSVGNIFRKITAIKKKGVHIPKIQKPIRYTSKMDGYVKEKY